MSLVWLNGRIVPEEEAFIPAADRGFLLGDGLFETMSVKNGQALDLEAHLQRLASGLVILGFAQAVDLDALRADIGRYAAAAGQSHCALRLTVTRGSGPRGLAPPEAPKPLIVMTLSPLPSGPRPPISVHIATATRRNEYSPLSRIKALGYADHVVALSEARAYGADDAILLNTRGTIACATVANVFALRQGRLHTPPVHDGALPGTMRAMVLSLAEQAGLEAREMPLEPEDLVKADAVFLTNSISRLVEAKTCGGAPVGKDAGATTERLRELVAFRLEAST